MSASTWYGPLKSSPKSPCSSPWSLVKTTSTSSVQPRSSIRRSTRPSASSMSSHSTALRAFTSRTWSAVSVAGHPAGRRLVVGDERPVVPETPVTGLVVEDLLPLARPSPGKPPAGGRRASRSARPRTAAGPTGGAGRGSSSSRTSRRRHRGSRATRSCGPRPSRCGISSRSIGLTFTWGAPVSPPPSALTCEVGVEHPVEAARPPRGAPGRATGRSGATPALPWVASSRCSKPRWAAAGGGPCPAGPGRSR